MQSTLETIEAEVLRLPAAERSRLLDRLIASLDADQAIEQAWDAEAARRDAEIESGASVPVDGKE
ncbi:MAG: addiction module protein, partial [Burkholderiales bacterium]